MNINATTLIQAFNFLIVYWMLRIFLFKPVIAIIEHNDAEARSLADIIDQQQKSLAIQEKERQKHWFLCQEYFTLHQPYQPVNTLSTSPLQSNPKIITQKISTESMAQLVCDVRKVLEEKIKHVH